MEAGAANVRDGTCLDGHSPLVRQSQSEPVCESYFCVARIHGLFKLAQYFAGLGNSGTHWLFLRTDVHSFGDVRTVFRHASGQDGDLVATCLEAISEWKSHQEILGP